MNFDYNKRLILLVLTGSRAYGTFHEGSDYDYRGVIIPPTYFYKSALLKFEQKEGLEGYGPDSSAYNITKFVKLAMDNNPNILEVLFTPDHLVKINTKYGERLRANRHLFISKKARHTLSGYAFAQLKRMKQHKAWWDRELAGDIPPKPLRANYGLPDQPKYSNDMLNQLMTCPTDCLKDELVDYVTRERKYHMDKDKYNSWFEWKSSRNPARYILEKDFGFDAKHGMHLVRLMTMGEELLTTGELIVERPDAEYLKSIKNGAVTFDWLVKWAEEMDLKLSELYETSTLQHEPKRQDIDQLCIDIITEAEKDGW